MLEQLRLSQERKLGRISIEEKLTLNKLSSIHDISAACFDSAVGFNIDLSKNHSKAVLLSAGCEFEKIAANGIDALYGKNDGETARYKPFLSFSINF